MNAFPTRDGAHTGIRGPSRAIAFAVELVRYAIDWIDDRQYVGSHRRYLEELDRRGELDGLLEAIGVTRVQLDAFAVSPLASAELLMKMMAHAGVGDVDIHDEAGDPELRCRACDNWRQCRRWIQRGANDDSYRTFCPNAALLDRLRERANRGPP
jgi:hypothetical protein